MDLGSIFLLIAVVILIALYISRPFFEKQTKPLSQTVQDAQEKEHQRSYYLAEQERIIGALQELDFDAALGKIPEEEYPSQRASLLHQGAEVLKQLDTLQEEVHPQTAEDRLEEAIAARRIAGSKGAASPVKDEDLEELIASRRHQREENIAGFCPQCGKPTQKSDRFCPRCGASLNS